MSTTLEAVRELLAKIPDLPALVKEASAPPVKILADNVWVYNAFDTITLNHLGIPYTFEQGKATMVKGNPDYWEIDQTKSEGQDIVRQVIPMKGEFIARAMIDERKYDEKGLMVIFTPKPTDVQKSECETKALTHIRTQIEAFKIHRERARAGTVGYKVVPDPAVYKWMQKYSPDDSMFADNSQNRNSGDRVAEAIALLTKLVTGQLAAPAATAPTEAPSSVPPNPVEMEGRPRRKPLERDEDYSKRCAEWFAALPKEVTV